MKLINADKVIEKLKEHKSLFCKNRDEFRALSDKDKARVDEIDTCIAELVNAEEVPHAQLGTNLAEVGRDCISRQAAINAIDKCYCGGEDSCGEPWIYKENAVEAINMIEPLPPIQPKRGKWHYSDGKPARIGLSFGVICDQCGTESEYCTNFCGECGADMRGEQNG